MFSFIALVMLVVVWVILELERKDKGDPLESLVVAQVIVMIGLSAGLVAYFIYEIAVLVCEYFSFTQATW